MNEYKYICSPQYVIGEYHKTKHFDVHRRGNLEPSPVPSQSPASRHGRLELRDHPLSNQ